MLLAEDSRYNTGEAKLLPDGCSLVCCTTEGDAGIHDKSNCPVKGASPVFSLRLVKIPLVASPDGLPYALMHFGTLAFLLAAKYGGWNHPNSNDCFSLIY